MKQRIGFVVDIKRDAEICSGVSFGLVDQGRQSHRSIWSSDGFKRRPSGTERRTAADERCERKNKNDCESHRLYFRQRKVFTTPFLSEANKRRNTQQFTNKETTLPKRRCPRRGKPKHVTEAVKHRKPNDFPSTKPRPCVKNMLSADALPIDVANCFPFSGAIN